MVVTASGDALFLGVLLGLAARDALAGGTGVLAGVATIGRWGSSSLAALAGGQAVLGPAGWTGSPAAVAASWAAAAALVLVAPPRILPAVAFGLLAAALVAGPALGDLSAVGPLTLRIGASVVAVAAAWACSQRVPRAVARRAGLAIGAAAAVLAFAG